jgi:long-chain fatty acid transport protein
MSKRVLACACLLILVAAPAFSANLDITPLHRQLQFNFGNPGARSLGMGGAFLGRADDASAAEANPAGLTIIAKPEFTIEVGQTEFTSRIPSGGTVGTTALYTEVNGDVGPNITFASVAAPVRNFVLSGYYHRPFDFEQSVPRQGAITSGQIGYLDGASEIAYGMDTFGAAGAWKTGGLSVGAALRYQRLDPKSFGELLDSAQKVLGSVGTSGSDSDLAYSVGFKWSNPSDSFGIGGVYKSGSSFSFQDSYLSPAGVEQCDGNKPCDSSLDAPDVLGLGVSIRPREGLTVNLDVNQIGYSSLLDDFDPGLPCSGGAGASSCYRLDDATEIHLGVEWTMPNASVPLALRAGYWRDPAHTVEYAGTTNDDLGRLADFLFPAGEDQNHVSVGIGYLGQTFEVNAAYDHADINSKASVSFLKRF